MADAVRAAPRAKFLRRWDRLVGAACEPEPTVVAWLRAARRPGSVKTKTAGAPALAASPVTEVLPSPVAWSS